MRLAFPLDDEAKRAKLARQTAPYASISGEPRGIFAGARTEP